jgi:hypothetical protein
MPQRLHGVNVWVREGDHKTFFHRRPSAREAVWVFRGCRGHWKLYLPGTYLPMIVLRAKLKNPILRQEVLLINHDEVNHSRQDFTSIQGGPTGNGNLEFGNWKATLKARLLPRYCRSYVIMSMSAGIMIRSMEICTDAYLGHIGKNMVNRAYSTSASVVP